MSTNWRYKLTLMIFYLNKKNAFILTNKCSLKRWRLRDYGHMDGRTTKIVEVTSPRKKNGAIKIFKFTLARYLQKLLIILEPVLGNG